MSGTRQYASDRRSRALRAAIEADFVGTHTAEFAGIQPTGRAVQVPYSVVYDLRGDQISALGIYFPMSLLIEQLTS